MVDCFVAWNGGVMLMLQVPGAVSKEIGGKVSPDDKTSLAFGFSLTVATPGVVFKIFEFSHMRREPVDPPHWHQKRPHHSVTIFSLHFLHFQLRQMSFD